MGKNASLLFTWNFIKVGSWIYFNAIFIHLHGYLRAINTVLCTKREPPEIDSGTHAYVVLFIIVSSPMKGRIVLIAQLNSSDLL